MPRGVTRARVFTVIARRGYRLYSRELKAVINPGMEQMQNGKQPDLKKWFSAGSRGDSYKGSVRDMTR